MWSESLWLRELCSVELRLQLSVRNYDVLEHLPRSICVIVDTNTAILVVVVTGRFIPSQLFRLGYMPLLGGASPEVAFSASLAALYGPPVRRVYTVLGWLVGGSNLQLFFPNDGIAGSKPSSCCRCRNRVFQVLRTPFSPVARGNWFSLCSRLFLWSVIAPVLSRAKSQEESLLQEEVCITEVEVSEQQTDDILLIDVDNRQYEDLFDDMTDEESEEEFDASDDNHCTDIVENSNDSE
ncbi:hypothetical protein YC2023_052682 [Brassica napus]